MAGLLGDVLPYIYSQSDRLKRNVRGLLDDPMGTMAQTAGDIQDKHRTMQGLLDQVHAGNRGKPLEQATGMAMNGLLGMAPVGMMAGVGAKTANKVALKAAQEMEGRGVPPATIWNQTGWGKGPDGMWRFEIDDSAAKMTPHLRKADPKEAINMEDALKHDALYRAYPDMRYYGIQHRTFPDAVRGSPGATLKGQDEIAMNNASQSFAQQGTLTPKVLHELQHMVQRKEGFQNGGSFAREGMDNYMRLAGEAEARMVEARQKLTPRQRSEQFPWGPDYFKEATGVSVDSLMFRNP